MTPRPTSQLAVIQNLPKIHNFLTHIITLLKNHNNNKNFKSEANKHAAYFITQENLCVCATYNAIRRTHAHQRVCDLKKCNEKMQTIFLSFYNRDGLGSIMKDVTGA